MAMDVTTAVALLGYAVKVAMIGGQGATRLVEGASTTGESVRNCPYGWADPTLPGEPASPRDSKHPPAKLDPAFSERQLVQELGRSEADSGGRWRTARP